uniref:Glycine transporter domain-containing protein n=1 Tax=Heterosigma akashiwo TaxID=2829 RepID=A0A6V1KF69_HETAK|mmetsp:Transcript_6272/g.11198  ORF Transcript_6272/g.11198 Transcript_6272/m.11198 type:complete len:354 (+) Transcript_6272:178-1239(+)
MASPLLRFGGRSSGLATVVQQRMPVPRAGNLKRSAVKFPSQVVAPATFKPIAPHQSVAHRPQVIFSAPPKPFSVKGAAKLSTRAAVELPCNSAQLLRGIHYVGTVAFAYNGATIAGSAGMHMLGCVIVGTINALGGGTLRDIMTGNTPVFWMRMPQFLKISLVTTAITFLLWPELHDRGLGLDKNSLFMILLDTCGVGAIAIVGAQNGFQLGLRPGICVMLGCISASFGGMVRDILCDQPPRILYNHSHLYASISIFTASSYVLSKVVFNAAPKVRIFTGLAVSFVTRLACWKFNIALPCWTYSTVDRMHIPFSRDDLEFWREFDQEHWEDRLSFEDHHHDYTHFHHWHGNHA